MTGLEKLLALKEGRRIEGAPTIQMPPRPNPDADAIAINPDQFELFKRVEGQAVLAHIRGPLARAMAAELDIVQIVRDNRAEGEATLLRLDEQTSAEIERATVAGVEGILYRLGGAYPAVCTPLEYGGLFLETDRQIMQFIDELRFNVLLIEGGRDAYIDAVSDLRADALGLEVDDEFDLSGVREIWDGPIAADHPDADIRLVYE